MSFISFIKKIFRNHYYLLTAFLLPLSFPTFDFIIFKFFPVVAFVSFIPLFHKLRGVKGFREIFRITFITGLISSFFMYSWMGAFGAGAPMGRVIVIAALVPALAGVFTLQASVSEILSRKNPKFRILIFSAIWLLFDLIKSLGYISFPWNYMGYSQYPFTWLIQISSITGVFGVTAVVISVNLLLTEIVFLRGRIVSGKKFASAQLMHFTPYLAIFSALIVFGAIRTNFKTSQKNDNFSIIVTQSCINPWDSWSSNKYRYLDEQFRITDQALSAQPDTNLILWTESSTIETVSYGVERGYMNQFTSRLLQKCAEYSRPMLVGEIGRVNDVTLRKVKWYNGACLINPDGKIGGKHFKTHLAPIGEWFPYGKWFPSVQNLINQMGGSDFTPGDKYTVLETSGKRFSVAICYESIFPEINRRFRLGGAQFIVNMTNDGWSDSYAGHMQHFAGSVFRAVENGLWVARAGNTGKTALISPYGKTTQTIPILEKGFLAGRMNLALNRHTFYTYAGNAFLYIYILSGLLLLIFQPTMIRSFMNRINLKR